MLLAHLVRRITAEGAVLGVYNRSVLSRLVVAATEEVHDSMQLCRRLRVELTTGEVIGPADNESVSGTGLSSCNLASDEIAVSEIVRDLVTGLWSLSADRRRGRWHLPRRAPPARSCAAAKWMGTW